MARKRPQLGPSTVRRDKELGSLPVIASFCARLDIRGIVDRACPVRDVALVTHGQVIEAMIANRLTSPRPLLHVEGWAREWAVEEVFGIAADTLNDDRVGRALDAAAPALEGIVGSVGTQAIAAFGLDVSRLHWDMTSMSLFGDHDSPEELVGDAGGDTAGRVGIADPRQRVPPLRLGPVGSAMGELTHAGT